MNRDPRPRPTTNRPTDQGSSPDTSPESGELFQQAGAFLAAGQEILQAALSTNSRDFLEASRQHGGQ